MSSESEKYQHAVYGMIRNPRRNPDGTFVERQLIPSICQMCGEKVWKTPLADRVAAYGGKVMCIKCAMTYAWKEM